MVRFRRTDIPNAPNTDCVSPEQIEALARLVSLLTQRGIGYRVETQHGELSTPFDLRIGLLTEETAFWLYPDGADASGAVELRVEIYDIADRGDDARRRSELFDGYLLDIATSFGEAPAIVMVELLNEGTSVWRPVVAFDVGDGSFRLSCAEAPEDLDEAWRFAPGTVVKCEWKTFEDGTEALAAVERVQGRD